MNDLPRNPASPRKKFRWRQLSLRGLFVIITACAVAAWWYGQPEIVEEFYEDGRPKSRAEVIRTPEDALVKNGRWTFWDETGQLRVAGYYRGGKPGGRWRYWHANGQLYAEGYFDDGKLHGPWTQWDERGQKRFQGKFEQGRLHGPASAWWDNGPLAGSGQYEQGKRAADWNYSSRDGPR
jgi:antitoxin component YwqK of YwqJK toxin-antitoxin module